MALNLTYQDELTAEDMRERLKKPRAGEYWLDTKAVRAERKAHERDQMAQARRRDMAACHGCRWPDCPYMPKKPRLEVSHCFEHRGAGGNPDGTRTQKSLLILACFIHHKLIDSGDAEVEALTDKGTDGICAFYERDEAGRMKHVATEKAIGVSVAVGR